MELKQIQYFVTLAEQLNFSRAAETLYISQPTLSYQIAELERELGAELFTRDKRKVFLTSAGGVLLPMAHRLLDCARDISDSAQNGFPEQQTRRVLRISLDRTEDHFEFTGITRRIADFSTAHPEVSLEMCQMDFGQCMRCLLNGDVDVSVLIMRHNESLPAMLTSRAVHRDRLQLVLRRDMTVHTCADVCGKYGIILVEDKPRGQRRVTRCLENMGLSPSIITVDSIPVSFTYMQAGRGAIPLPGNYVRQHRYKNIMTVDIPDPAAELTHMLVWNKSNHNPSIQLLVNAFDEPDEQ